LESVTGVYLSRSELDSKSKKSSRPARCVSSEDTPLRGAGPLRSGADPLPVRGADPPLRGLCDFGEHTPLRCV
jgi:hypothetical protein